jgi:hypothetical protein
VSVGRAAALGLLLSGCAAGAKQGLALGMLFLALVPVLLLQIVACLAAWKQERPAWSLAPVVVLMLVGVAGAVVALMILADTSPSVRERVAIESFSLPALQSLIVVGLGFSVLGYAWERDAPPSAPRRSKPYVVAACLACLVAVIVPTIVLCSEPPKLREQLPDKR